MSWHAPLPTSHSPRRTRSRGGGPSKTSPLFFLFFFYLLSLFSFRFDPQCKNPHPCLFNSETVGTVGEGKGQQERERGTPPRFTLMGLESVPVSRTGAARTGERFRQEPFNLEWATFVPNPVPSGEEKEGKKTLLSRFPARAHPGTNNGPRGWSPIGKWSKMQLFLLFFTQRGV